MKQFIGGTIKNYGQVSLYVPRSLTLKDIISMGLPVKGMPQEINLWRKNNFYNHLLRGIKQVLLSKMLNIPTRYGTVYLTKISPIDIPERIVNELVKEYSATETHGLPSFPFWVAQKGFKYESLFFGLASFRVVTTVGVGYIVDAWQNSVELEDMKYHALGTGSTAEAAGDTALVTELTTEYTGNVRATGTTTEGASANIFRTVGTNTLDGTPGAALREHGIFNQAATGGGVLMDRTVFAAITLSSGDSLQSTYDQTQTAGS